MAIEKKSRFWGPFWSYQPIQPINHKNGSNGLNWQCCLAGSSKPASTILIFSIAMGAKNSFDLISIVHWVRWINNYRVLLLVYLALSVPIFHDKSILVGVISSYTVVDLAKICTTPLFKRFQWPLRYQKKLEFDSVVYQHSSKIERIS